MPTQPLPPPLLPTQDNRVLLRFLPRKFVEFLDEKFGILMQANGGYGQMGFSVRRGEPTDFLVSETHKGESWEDRESA